MIFSARLHGLDALRAQLSRIADTSDIRDQIEAAADEILAAAQTNLQDGESPESRTGALARSLRAEIARDGLSATVGTSLDYGWRLEFGGLDRPAAPWLGPALDAARPTILSRLKSRLASTVKIRSGV